MDMNIGLSIGAVILGGVITFICSRFYYIGATGDLNKETAELRRLNKLMLLGMEHAGWVTLNKDNQGNILGFVYTIYPQNAHMTIAGSVAPTQIAKGDKNEK